MDKLIREDYVLGNKKIVVGDNLHDLVLENLGKIWVRYGNSYKEFSQFVSTLAKATSDITKVIIEPNGAKEPEAYNSGVLVFDARKKNLYLKYQDSLLLLLEYNDGVSEKYVAKAGDTMTGPLTINVKKGAPLKIESSDFVENLNVEYLHGHPDEDFAQKAEDEEITGNWTFLGNDVHNGLNLFNNQVIINGKLTENSSSEFAGKATFKNEIEVSGTGTFKSNGTAIRVGTGDIITDGSMGSSQFMSGMTGYGWRLDANTNTLTIDNLIVRGVLNVFELVVNKITATNGSFWITDSFKIDKVHNIQYLKAEDVNIITEEDYKNFLELFNEEDYYIIYSNSFNKSSIDLTQNTEHPFATRNSQEPIVNTKVFDKFDLIFKINKLDEFKSLFTYIELENTYTDLNILCDRNTLNNLHINEIIRLSHIFQNNPKTISDMEIVDVDHLINPDDAEEKFEDQLFTIVDASLATLENGVYSYSLNAMSKINLYCKYFASNLENSMNLYVLESNHDEFPVFKPGDILKCLKFTGNLVKLYHALVLGLVDDYSYVVLLQKLLVVLEGTMLEYNENGYIDQTLANLDTTLYNRSEGLEINIDDYIRKAKNIIRSYMDDPQDSTLLLWAFQVLFSPENWESYYQSLLNSTSLTVLDVIETINMNSIDSITYEECLEHPIFKKLFEFETISAPVKDDALVRIGNIFFNDRRNSMYLTSSELNSPYTDVLVGVNRPDYTVIYLTPKYVKFEAANTNRKGQYYLQSDEFGELIENGNAGQLTGNDLIKYNKFKDFSIKLDMIEGGETNFQKTFVKLTFLPNENTLHNLDGSLMTLDVDGVTYYVSSTNANIISNELAFNDVESGTFVLDSQNTIHLTIGG